MTDHILFNYPAPIGAVELVDIILWWDGPRAVVWQGIDKTLWITVNSDNAAGFDYWLWVPVTLERLQQFVDGIVWRKIFTEPEGPVYVVAERHNAEADQEATVEEIDVDAILSAWLPIGDTQLVASDSLKKFVKTLEAQA